MSSPLRSVLISAVATCLGCTAVAMAGSVPVDNHGFQDPVTGTWTGSQVSWTHVGTANSFGAVQQGYGNSTPPAPDGDQWAFFSGGAEAYQQVGTLLEGTAYRLGLKIGRRSQALGTYSIGLYSGPGATPTTPLATIANPSLPDPVTSTGAALTYYSPPGNPVAGENLFIRLQNASGGQLLVDDVALLVGDGVGVSNPGFESPDVGPPNPNGWKSLDVRNWSVKSDVASDDIGVLVETLTGTPPDPIGKQWSFLNASAAGGSRIWQAVGLIEPDTNYTLDAVVGRRGGDPLNYRAGFYAGTIDGGPAIPLATVDTPVDPAVGASLPLPTISYSAEPGNPQAGKVLFARFDALAGGTQQALFDNVAVGSDWVGLVRNPGFEKDLPALQNDYDYQPGIVTDWIAAGAAATFNPYPTAEAGVGGQIVVFSNGASDTISQTLDAVLETGKLYTLSANVGSQAAGSRSYQVRLKADGQLLAQDLSTLTLGPGMTETATVRFSAPPDHPLLGDNLEIVLNRGAGGAGQVLFDDVQLDVIPIHTVINPSFEQFTADGNLAPPLANGQYIHFAGAGSSGQPEPIDVIGWTQVGGNSSGAGLYNPPSGYPNGEVPDGDQILFINDATYVSQVLPDVLEAGRVYDLSVSVGATSGAPTYDVGLYADGQLLGNVTSLTGPAGVQNAFIEVSVSVTAAAYPGLLGEPLEIRLAKILGSPIQTQFDSVMLTSVPEPSALVLAGLAAIGMLGFSRRRRLV